MAWYDDILDTAGSVGNSLLDAGKFTGKAILAAKAPAMYNAMMAAENRDRQTGYRG